MKRVDDLKLEALREKVKLSDDRVEHHIRLCNDIHKTYELKNRKYGNSFSKTYEEYGPVMLCIRLDDKLGRLKQLLLNGETGTKDESVIDTLLDLANYAIMGVMEIESKDENL